MVKGRTNMYDRETAAKRAESHYNNDVGMCQKWTRDIFGAPSAGDRDRDGDADAVDGWLSEPDSAKHPGDRNPPRGVPVSWSGGSSGFGHRAVSLGNGKIRSTDAGGRGRIATVDLDWVEKNWGMKYLGWSETITGQYIPLPKPDRKDLPRGDKIDSALDSLKKAKGKGRRRNLIRRAKKILRKIKPVK